MPALVALYESTASHNSMEQVAHVPTVRATVGAEGPFNIADDAVLLAGFAWEFNYAFVG